MNVTDNALSWRRGNTPRLGTFDPQLLPTTLRSSLKWRRESRRQHLRFHVIFFAVAGEDSRRILIRRTTYN